MENPRGIDNLFEFAILASKRARQLINGRKRKLDMKAENPLTIAIEEIKQGLVTYENLNQLDQIDNIAEIQTEETAEAILSQNLADLQEIESTSELDEPPEEEFEEESDDELDED